ncbi:MAG: glycosyltransferase family 2 protein [Pyrinomonadaceae bacterium]|nr:glycosyltransferase family 2 protein [Pyrinomonadaceae bacterium]
MRQYLGPFLGPISKHISSARRAAQVISRSPRHGVKLLFNSRSEPRIQSQPDVYPFAAYLAERFECTHVIVLGKPTATNLMQLYPRFEVIGIVPGSDLGSYRSRYGFGTWLEADMDRGGLSLPEDVLKRAIIVCKDLEQFVSSASFLKNLRTWLDHAPVCVLTSSDRDLNSTSSNGSATPARPGSWNLTELEQLLRAEALKVEFIGLTASDSLNYEKKTILAVITNSATLESVVAPATFRVVAFMAAYNEEDIIVQSIKKWTDQGVSVHILENWSTDGTYDLAKELEGRLPVTVERFPKEGPSNYFDWEAILERMEALSREIEADWFVRRGADEILASPWPGVSYRDGLYLADQAGFNCIDHTIVEFHPVDNGFETGMDHEAYFRHFDLKHLSHPRQRKAWKNCGQPISTIPSAGHDVIFEGRRIYPFKFLLKHYSFRSQSQAEKKVFRERKARWNPKERARGWHIHYDSIQEGHRFVQLASAKEVFDEDRFNKTYLVERLSGIGTRRNNLI